MSAEELGLSSDRSTFAKLKESRIEIVVTTISMVSS